MSMLRRAFLGTEILAWYIDLNGIENMNIVKYSYSILVLDKHEILVIDT